MLSVLAADSMEGRGLGTAGAARAARYIASVLQEAGVPPAGDSAYFQRIAPREVNVAALLPGRDPAVREQVILVDAHFDHLGIGRPVNGDSIYNGADDDASGVVAVLEIARALARDPPRRSVLFLLTTGEERGLVGTRWFLAHPIVPLDSIAANLEIEMIGRPDGLLGPGRAWLTGYERSTMGPMFSAAGLAIVPDPRPLQRFFQRSDNIAFARRGIPAHTLSTFGLHGDYHRPSDEFDRIDLNHLRSIIQTAIGAVKLLANSDSLPVWKPGGQPAPRGN
jgi:Zn-dependent M28 family amino/carboxypeptidase